MNKRQAKKLWKKDIKKHYMNAYNRHVLTNLRNILRHYTKQYTFDRNILKDDKVLLKMMPYASCEVFDLIPIPKEGNANE